MLVFASVKRVVEGHREEPRRLRGARPRTGARARAHRWRRGRRGGPRPEWHHEGTTVGRDTIITSTRSRTTPFLNYQKGTSFFVGMLHGVGAETPTQMPVFHGGGGRRGEGAGIAVLAAFLVGLMTSNSIITMGSAFGFLRASKNFAVYATVAVM